MESSETNGGRRGGMRTDMLIMGVALILVGVILLFTSMNPEIDFSDLFLTWWPVLLILAGLIKILQSVTGQNQHGVLGAFFFLFIILALASGALWSFFDGQIWFGDWWAHQIQRESDVIDASEIELITIRSLQTDVKIVSSNDDEIVIRGDLRSNKDINDEWDDNDYYQLVSFKQEGQTLDMLLNANAISRFDENIYLHVEITVPKDLEVKITGNRADISIYGLHGNLTASTERGDIYLRDCSGYSKASVLRGDLTIRDAEGTLDLDGDVADIEIYNAYADIIIAGERADIEIDNDYPLAGSINIVNDRGYVELELDSDSSFNFNGETGSGRVYLDFQDKDASYSDSYQFSNLDGRYAVNVKIGRGNISLDD
jgi:hypothetical protein